MEKSPHKKQKKRKNSNEPNFMIQTLKYNCNKLTNEINLFQIIYSEFPENNEQENFDKLKELLKESQTIFKDMEQRNKNILDKWKNKLKNYSDIDEFMKQLKNYDKIKNEENYDNIIKNILILTKKDICYSDIKSILYLFKLFKAEQTELSENLITYKNEYKNIEIFNFDKLVDIYNYLEEINIYNNNGRNDSALIKFIRLLYNKEKEINYLSTKEVDITSALFYKQEPKIYSLKFEDILQYINCINFIKDLKKEKLTDNNLLIKVNSKLTEQDINQLLSSFNCFFTNFDKFKLLDSKDFYGKIKSILNNSKFELNFFKKEFKIYDDNKREIKDILIKDLDGLIRLKNNINISYTDFPDNIILDNKQKEELNKKKANIELFAKYVDNLQTINNYFIKLKNKGFPIFIEVQIITTKYNIIYKLGDNIFEYDELISNLKECYVSIKQYRIKFYKENEYFRFIYNQQIYRILKRITNKNKDISSYIKFFTESNSLKDEVPLFISKFNNISNILYNCEIVIEEKFEFISKYIKHIFKINNTSLSKLYENIKVNNGLKGIYQCYIHKCNMELFILKIFFKLTESFPIAQNILLTNNETSTGEIISFMYRALKCKFNTLFIISIMDDLPMKKIYLFKKLLNQIIQEMKKENTINEINDLNPCILFLIQNELKYNIFFSDSEVNDLSTDYIGNENKLEYAIDKLLDNEIYNHTKIYSSDCCGLGKSHLIKKEIKEKGEEYYYFPVGGNLTKEGLYQKLKKFLKHEIKGKNKIGIHLDLFYTKNISIMKYFLVSNLITKFYQVNDNILYIPKNIDFYVEIPNGPHYFLDNYSFLTIFKRVNISIDDPIPLDFYKENVFNNILLDKKIVNLTYIEKKIYINIIKYLNENKNGDKISEEKIKSLAYLFSNNVYSQKIKEKEISYKNKTEKEKNNYLFDLFNFDAENLNIKYNVPIIFNTKNGYLEIDISENEIQGKDMNYFISNLKKVMSFEESDEEIEEILGDYKITEDNYKKMILILFRLYANIPVILQGETGCGKTELIKILCKLLNKDEESQNLFIKNINPDVKENQIIELIEMAKENIPKAKNDFIYILFEEVDISSFPSKMKEIFVNHSLNGIEIDEKIRFIGTCLPFMANQNNNNISFIIHSLPNSMLHYLFYFTHLENNDIKNYIELILEDEFPKDENEESENSILRKIAIDAIYDSYISIKEYNRISSVSLRDIQRFKIAYNFFKKYYLNKKEFLEKKGDEILDKFEEKSKIQSLVLSLYITYYIRIIKPDCINKYLEKINPDIKSLANKLKIKEWLDNLNWKSGPFKYIIKKEEDFLLKEMEINNEKEISNITPLKENILVMFFSIYSYIPLIIVGKTGCSKSLSVQLIKKKLVGKLNNFDFLKNYSSLNTTIFYGSEMNTPETIENIFKEIENKKESNPLLVFDNLDLLGKNQSNFMNILSTKLEMNLNKDEKNKISFIGISNTSLDPFIMNRALFLSLSDLKVDDIYSISEVIANNIGNNLFKLHLRKYVQLGTTYFNYKNDLSELNDEFIDNFHGSRDIYNIIKTFSNEMIKNNKSDDNSIIEHAFKKSLARNLNGLEINGEISLKKYMTKVNFDNINIIECIKENITSKDNRFLLLISEKSMFDYIIDIMKKEIEQINNNYVTIIGSPFNEDKKNLSYNIEMILNIERYVAEGKIVILFGHEQIYSIFYDLFNQNYIIKNEKKYYYIHFRDNAHKLSLINENTKIIILVDKKELRKQNFELLNRFEKYNITFDNFLNDEEKEKSKIINNILEKIFSVKDINNNLKNILVNINLDIINGYVHLYKNKEKNSYKNIIKEIIMPILPQDIIFTLSFSDLNNDNDTDKKEFDSVKRDIDLYNKHNSLEEYLKSDEKGNEDILIVYTFSKIIEIIQLTEKENYLEILASGINSCNKLKKILTIFYENENYKSLIIKFDSETGKYINYFISEIYIYKETHKINNDNKNYIFTVNIQREFDLDKNDKDKEPIVFIKNEKIKQLFIDNINGAELSIKETKRIEINDYINKNHKKIILDELKIFFKENKNKISGKCKGIDSNNFLKEFILFNEKNEEIIIIMINRIILSQFDNNTNIIESIIKNNYIDKNTTDFVSLIIKYMKKITKEKIKILLRQAEHNNFFTNIFILNKKEVEEKENDQSKDYYFFNISDNDILNNDIIKKIKNEFIKILKEGKNDIEEHKEINIKLNYKIPGLFFIYKEIKEYIEKEKLPITYFQYETELRNCNKELIGEISNKSKNEIKSLNEKLYQELSKKQLLTKIIQMKNYDKNYNDFVEIFLNDYITFYLENIYDNQKTNFEINDTQHRIILLLLEIKSKNLKEDEIYEKPIQNLISKILWLETYSTYIKDIIDIYDIISENGYKEKDKLFLFKQIINYISKNEIKFEQKELDIKKLNASFYIIIKSILNYIIEYNYEEYFEICLNQMKKLDKILKLNIIELNVLNDFIIINKIFPYKEEKVEKDDEKEIKYLIENLKDKMKELKKILCGLIKEKELNFDLIYYELIANTVLNDLLENKNFEYKYYIFKELLLKDARLYIQINNILKLNLHDYNSKGINDFKEFHEKISDTNSFKENISQNYVLKLIDNTDLNEKNDSIKPEETKEIINDTNMNKEECISINSELIIKKEKRRKIDELIEKIKSIINLFREKKIFFIYLSNEFWKLLLNLNIDSTLYNILIFYRLRKVFIEYYESVNYTIEKEEKFSLIKNEAEIFYQRDEYAILLDQLITIYIKDNNKLTSIEKLCLISEYNPYYQEEKYSTKVDCSIFDLFDLNVVDNDFISDFRKINFEKIFKFKIKDYINKLLSKIKSISDFDKIIKLINIKNIYNKDIYIDELNKKDYCIIKTQIHLLKDEKLMEAIKVAARIALINFNYEKRFDNFNFIENKIKKLNKNIILLIFCEIIKIYISDKIKQKNEEENDFRKFC